jgi:energy-converting hydrogenase A subunit M
MAQPADFSMATADKIDNEVKALVERAYRRAKDLLTANIDVLHKVAAVLIEKENIDGEEFQQIIMDTQVRGGCYHQIIERQCWEGTALQQTCHTVCTCMHREFCWCSKPTNPLGHERERDWS